MLYDPNWAPVETKPDVFSLDGLIAWLETRSVDGIYCYTDSGNCLLCQYFTANGFQGIALDAFGFSHDGWNTEVRYPSIFNEVAIQHPRTFGAALERARAARSS